MSKAQQELGEQSHSTSFSKQEESRDGVQHSPYTLPLEWRRGGFTGPGKQEGKQEAPPFPKAPEQAPLPAGGGSHGWRPPPAPVPAAHLMMVMNCVMVSSSGTRNLVLSRRGRYFSFWYLSTITCFNQSRLEAMKASRPEVPNFKGRGTGSLPRARRQKRSLTGIFVGNLALMPATSSSLVAARERGQALPVLAARRPCCAPRPRRPYRNSSSA